jgi:anti-sigma regulatory factor (Ser/Thr protein kinase)
MSTSAFAATSELADFRHEALLYAGTPEFVEGCIEFVRGGLEADEPVLVVVGAEKIELLRSELGEDADRVLFADMADVGLNPGRIISAWRDFMSGHDNCHCRPRGIGEPIYPERGPAELIECQRHEALLNLAFDGTPGWWLVCPYDVTALSPAVIDESLRSHPWVYDGGRSRRSDRYAPLERGIPARLDPALPEPAELPEEYTFTTRTLWVVREAVVRHATRLGLPAGRTGELAFAVHEAATNSLRYGGGEGVLRLWREGDAAVAEVRDHGWVDDPLVGRAHPGPDPTGGRGLWMVNQLCDLVELRSAAAAGTAIRMQMSRSAPDTRVPSED